MRAESLHERRSGLPGQLGALSHSDTALPNLLDNPEQPKFLAHGIESRRLTCSDPRRSTFTVRVRAGADMTTA